MNAVTTIWLIKSDDQLGSKKKLKEKGIALCNALQGGAANGRNLSIIMKALEPSTESLQDKTCDGKQQSLEELIKSKEIKF